MDRATGPWARPTTAARRCARGAGRSAGGWRGASARRRSARAPRPARRRSRRPPARALREVALLPVFVERHRRRRWREDTIRPAHGQPDLRPDRAFFGHPRGLSTLFFTEMWERFSYYGMRALLILFMTAPVGGRRARASTPRDGGAIYGLYTSMVYLASAAGRLDRRPAPRPAARGALRRHPHRGRPLQHGRSVAGRRSTSAWSLIVLGTGLLKPQRQRRSSASSTRRATRGATPASRSSTWASTSARSSRRSSAATWGSASTGTSGFGAAGVGMTLGVIQYVAGRAAPRRSPALHPVPAATPEAARRAGARRPRPWGGLVLSR